MRRRNLPEVRRCQNGEFTMGAQNSSLDSIVNVKSASQLTRPWGSRPPVRQLTG